MLNEQKRLVEVCTECGRACCWHGEFMCYESKHAGTEKKTVAELKKTNLEHESYYSKETIKKVYGEEAPHGYLNEINKLQLDILWSLNDHSGQMTYVIRNILSNEHWNFNYDWKSLKTNKILYNLKKLESIGLVTRVTGRANVYKTQLKWMLTPMRD